MTLFSQDRIIEFNEKYRESIDKNEAFWALEGMLLILDKAIPKIKDVSYNEEDLHIRWYHDGTLNACYNCIDRHLEKNGDKTAIIWEGDDAKDQKQLTFRELHSLTCKIANVLKSKGVKKGDRVLIYLPMIPEAFASMLACARIGAVHSVVFSAFSAMALASRIGDCGAKVIITADGGFHGGKAVHIKEKVDHALQDDEAKSIESVLVIQHTKEPVDMITGRDFFMEDEYLNVSDDCPCEEMEAEDPLFILYTSGSTGKPKGVLHTTGGYLVFSAMTFKECFDYKPDDVYWCPADIGWITGHTYGVYGPLSNGATSVIFEGIPTYPNYSRYWEMIDRYKVTIFHTAPTVLRSLMREGLGPVLKTSRKSLRIIGTVGEPINEAAWHWFHDVIGEGRCQIADTWFQTETGGFCISPIPNTALKQVPGSIGKAFYGIDVALLSSDGTVIEGEGEGALVILNSWPGQMRTVYGNHRRFFETYFQMFPGIYCTADAARRDKDGNYWITGRLDDVIKVSGHRLGSAEIESAFVKHDKVAEAAVVGYPHEIKGEGIYAFITLLAVIEPSDDIKHELIQHIREAIGPIAVPDFIQFTIELPKTRSGKIMRRILRKIASDQTDTIGDISTLANPDIVHSLVAYRVNLKE